VGSRNSGVFKLSYLLFVDDTLILYGANLDHLHYLHALFFWFEAVFGLKINLVKSELVLVGNVNNVDGLAPVFWGLWSFFFVLEISWSSVGSLFSGQIYLG
jgi:hypothetical protein